jgi:hypothetical protein
MDTLSTVWAALPDIAKVVAGIVALVGGLVAALSWAYKSGLRDTARKAQYERDRNALEKLYGPLVSLFVNVHLSASTSIRYPRIGQRVQHAIAVVTERRYIKGKISGFWYALFDKGVSEPAVEVEYGDSYPTAAIGKILKDQAHLAPPRLLQLYRIVAREDFEREMSGAHLELIDYIHDEHERLSKRLMAP